MLIKLGVDISRLKRDIRRALNKIEHISRRVSGRETVVTSTYEGNHSPGSLHYADRAVDIRLAGDLMTNKNMVRELQKALGRSFDVVLETTHIHIEYDQKK